MWNVSLNVFLGNAAHKGAASMDNLRRLTQDQEDPELGRNLYRTVQDNPQLEKLCIPTKDAMFSTRQNKIPEFGASDFARVVSASLCLIVLWIIGVEL